MDSEMTPNEIIKAMDRLVESNSDLYNVERNACREAASLILDMREILRVIERDASRCPVCDTNLNQYENHEDDCKLAKVLKD